MGMTGMGIVSVVMGGVGTNVVGCSMALNRVTVINVSVSVSASVKAKGAMACSIAINWHGCGWCGHGWSGHWEVGTQMP